MRTALSTLVLSLAATLLAAAPGSAEPADDWRGSTTAQPEAYAWLDDLTPDVDYDVLTVRGLTPAQVRRTLGTVTRRLPAMTPARAERWTSSRLDLRDYSAPCMALVDRRGPAVVVYLPYWFAGDAVERLSRHGTAAGFTTTVELDTYVTVAKRGRVVREFDAGFRPPSRGALPQERGLDWGARDQNIWATAWAFNERVTRVHLGEEWFQGPHPAYRFRGTC